VSTIVDIVHRLLLPALLLASALRDLFHDAGS
jgi:hypothetical protein